MALTENPETNTSVTRTSAGRTPVAKKPETNLGRFLRRFRSQRGAMVATCYLVLLVLVALLAPWIAPYDPIQQNLAHSLRLPVSEGHLLGTDLFGRDTLSRLIYASQVALIATVQALAIGLGLGVIPGLVAGVLRGKVDLVIMRLTDALMSFPGLILSISIVGILGPGLTNAMTAVGIIFAPVFLRVVRASVLEVREETYIEAARSVGTSTPRIIVRHVLPNALPPLLVQISLAAGVALLSEAGLSFLGLGVQPPAASWGVMLWRGYETMNLQPWEVILPGLAISVTVLAFNVIGDGLRDSIGKEVRR